MLDGCDVKITQKGHIYTVSGKDTEKLYGKLKSTPPAAQRFKIGELKDGLFTMEKMATQQAAAPEAMAVNG